MATDEELEAMAEQEAETQPQTPRNRQLEDFRYDEQQEKFWDITSGILLPAKSVDAAIHPDDWPRRNNANGEPVLTRPSKVIPDISTGLTVEGSTWWPGQPQFIRNYAFTASGIKRLEGATYYNTYEAPEIEDIEGDPSPWLDHVKMLFPNPLEHEHLFDYFAHAVQRPGEKVNHGIVIAGGQGIGKDSALWPVRQSVGTMNYREINPDDVHSQYNGWIQSSLLVINEVRPVEKMHKANAFYNRLKTILAAPPDTLALQMKYANVVYIPNVCHVVLTTNDPLSMYVDDDDRRLFIVDSIVTREKLGEAYFEKLWHWLREKNGWQIVANWLRNRDILNFNPSAPPPMTDAKRQVLGSAFDRYQSDIGMVLERYFEEKCGDEKPLVIFPTQLLDFIHEDEWFDDKAKALNAIKSKSLAHDVRKLGYDAMKNPRGTEWVVKRDGKRYRARVAFVRRDVPMEDRVIVVKDFLAKAIAAKEDGTA